jgi:hypothetical protein
METRQNYHYYKPTLIRENPLPLEEEDIAYAKELLATPEAEGGFIPVKLEQDVVVQRISHDLYAKPESGFRELYNNEVRACRTAQKIFGAKPRMVISIDPATRELEIRGVDSTGMSAETFKNVYTVIGRSSNFSGEEIGQFGFGHISYCTLSEIMVLETKYRTPEGETGEYAIMGKNGVGFNILPRPSVGPFGTVVKLVLKSEVNLRRLVEYICEACTFSGIPTYLNLAADLRGEPGVSWGREKQYARGCVQLNKTYQEKAEEAANRSSYYHHGGKLAKTFQIALEGAELYAEFRVGEKEYAPLPSSSTTTLLRIGKDTRLIGSPIEIGIDLPFSYFVLNVLDERRYQPTADRERLREEATKSLLDQLNSKVREVISSYLAVMSIQDFLALDGAKASVFLSGEEIAGEDDPTCVAHFLPEETRNLRSLLLREVKVYREQRQEGYHPFHGRRRKNLAGLLKGRELGEVFFTPAGTRFNQNQIERILQQIPRATFFQLLVPSAGDGEVSGAGAEEGLLREDGIRSIAEYFRENKEKLLAANRPQGMETLDEIHVFESVVGYYSWGRFAKPTRHVQSERADQILPQNVIRLQGGSVRKYTSLLSKLKTTYKLVKDHEQLRGGVGLDDFVLRLKEKKIVFTSWGRMGLIDLLQNSRNEGKGREWNGRKYGVSLYLYSDPELAKFFTDSGDIKIFDNEDSLFEIAVFLTYHSIDFSLDTEMAELFDGESRKSSTKIMRAQNFSRANFLNDYSWEKLGDSEILGSVIQVYGEIQDEQIDLLFARAVQGSRDPSEVTDMRKSLLSRWKLS